MNEFVSWDILTTYAGAVIMTTIIVQFTKNLLDRLVHIPTQLYAIIIAFIIIILANLYTGSLTLSKGVLTLLNAVIVGSASSGSYSNIEKIAELSKGFDFTDTDGKGEDNNASDYTKIN